MKLQLSTEIAVTFTADEMRLVTLGLDRRIRSADDAAKARELANRLTTDRVRLLQDEAAVIRQASEVTAEKPADPTPRKRMIGKVQITSSDPLPTKDTIDPTLSPNCTPEQKAEAIRAAESLKSEPYAADRIAAEADAEEEPEKVTL